MTYIMPDIYEICFAIAAATQLCFLIYVIMQGFGSASFGDIPNWKSSFIGAVTGSFLAGLVAVGSIHYNNWRENERRQKRLLTELNFELSNNYRNAEINFNNANLQNMLPIMLEDRVITEFLKEKVKPKGWSDADTQRIMRIASLIRHANDLFTYPFNHRFSTTSGNPKYDYSKDLMNEITELDQSHLEELGNIFEIWQALEQH